MESLEKAVGLLKVVAACLQGEMRPLRGSAEGEGADFSQHRNARDFPFLP